MKWMLETAHMMNTVMMAYVAGSFNCAESAMVDLMSCMEPVV